MGVEDVGLERLDDRVDPPGKGRDLAQLAERADHRRRRLGTVEIDPVDRLGVRARSRRGAGR